MKLIRDVTAEMRMPADSFAGLFESEERTWVRYWLAWGKGYELLTDTPDTYEGRVLLAMRAEDSTAEHGVEHFDTLDDALGRIGDIADALEARP